MVIFHYFQIEFFAAITFIVHEMQDSPLFFSLYQNKYILGEFNFGNINLN